MVQLYLESVSVAGCEVDLILPICDCQMIAGPVVLQLPRCLCSGVPDSIGVSLCIFPIFHAYIVLPDHQNSFGLLRRW